MSMIDYKTLPPEELFALMGEGDEEARRELVTRREARFAQKFPLALPEKPRAEN